ncbi:MAG: hypothetical protein WAO19_10770 [Candidatus Kryptoniota bacterium]
MGIEYWEDIGFRKFSVLSKHNLGGQVRSSEMPCVSYQSRYAQLFGENCRSIDPEMTEPYTDF